MKQVVCAGFERQDGEATPIPLIPPAFERLKEINRPALIMIGEYDGWHTYLVADELECQLPHNRKVSIPGVAHMIPLECPDVFNHLVYSFLKEEA